MTSGYVLCRVAHRAHQATDRDPSNRDRREGRMDAPRRP
ncbi:hypothetical protein F4692_001356 [Nocardioides cavernae]|uniref:Uncharacterized protein n=1 Tax=Nocardioides cavernae TaxID=1921566 RepID=A0A7Y9KSB7_9ACTN|nr:hypothetical protein [Nocardioides cavernae]